MNARPECAVCRKPVAEFTETVDHFMGRVRFTARCHGATETVDVPIVRVHIVRGFGQAFASPLQLPEST